MIFNELNTPFRFYDDLDKQNRFKDNCAAICDFQLLCPENTILPFQLSLPAGFAVGTDNWYVRCVSDDSIVADLTTSIPLIELENGLPNFEYFTYKGDAIVGLSLGCGNYYLELVINLGEDGDGNEVLQSYFSEVFTVIEDLTDISFTQSDFSLFTAWRWYNNSNKLTENLTQCAAVCQYTLFSGNDALLPFQFRVPSGATSINSWTLINGDCYIGLDDNLITIEAMDGYDNIIYVGGLIDLPCGTFYSQIVIDGVVYYSEPITIVSDFETDDSNYILQEDGFILLQETNFGLLQE